MSVASALRLLHQLSLESTSSSTALSSSLSSSTSSLPASTAAASSPPISGRHVAVLGDMLELGSQSERAHLDALSLCLSLSGISLVLTAGAGFKSALGKMVQRGARGGAGEGVGGGDEDDLAEAVALSASVADSPLEAHKETMDMGLIRTGDVVLVKGSRGLRMEIVCDAIRSEFG
ncbi:unnamed protein product [Closterium sp. NIES-53]